MGSELAVRSTTTALAFDAGQRKLIRDTFASGASEQEFAALIAVAERRGLDPFLRQVYFVQRWDSQKSCMVWAVQVSIDGLRGIAQKTGLYDGQDEPEFEYDAKGGLKSCRVRVYRKDWSRPSVAVAHWGEYAQKKKDGSLTAFWAGKPHIMLAKCAEALAIRKAFPEDTGGIYTAEEMGEEPINITPVDARPSKPARTPELDAAVKRAVAQVVGPTTAAAQTIEQTPPSPSPAEPPHDPQTGEVSLSVAEKLRTRIDAAVNVRPALVDLGAEVAQAAERGAITQEERLSLGQQIKARQMALAQGVAA